MKVDRKEDEEGGQKKGKEEKNSPPGGEPRLMQSSWCPKTSSVYIAQMTE